MRKILILAALFVAAGAAVSVSAQDMHRMHPGGAMHSMHAAHSGGAMDCAMCRPLAAHGWEVGAGVSVFQFPRVRIGALQTTETGHRVDMQIRQAVWAGNIYAARALSPSLAADFQTSIGAAESKLLLVTGLGLQYRVGHLFRSRQIDPYLRVGANYLYKGFPTWYDDGTMGYEVRRAGGHHLFAAALGAGTNLWLNDRLGIGLQGDYVLIPRRGVQGSAQGTARVIWRFGK